MPSIMNRTNEIQFLKIVKINKLQSKKKKKIYEIIQNELNVIF